MGLGDMGLIDSDGYVHLVGRAKDLIISSGLNVYPKEIEVAIDALDGVIESAVFAIPHRDFTNSTGGLQMPQARVCAG
jgi:malonyl-CoA/methylmalonyl-CoA synthetase